MPQPAPYDRSTFPMLQLLRFRRDPLGFLESVAARGDVVRFGPRGRFHLVAHPDGVREVLVVRADAFIKGPALRQAKATLGEGLLTSEGDAHRRQRRLAQPAFHATRVAAYGDVMAAYADRQSARWADGATIDAHAHMTRLTLEIVAKTLFDADVGADVDRIGRAMDESVAMFSRLLLPFGSVIARLPLPANRRFRRTWPALVATVDRFIADRRATPGVERNDLLSMLLNATDVDGDGAGHGGGRGMTDRQLRDEAITIFTAGHETTANGLTFTLHLLAHHPDALATLQREVDEVTAGRLPTAADADRMPYARAVVSESMRLYPPVWTVGREATTGVTIAGHALPAGSVVLASQWVAHHDPRWWPDATRFDPGRWLAPDPARPRYAYFPFAGGPRGCIGEAFAWLEMTLALAAVVRRWNLLPAGPRDLPLRPSITLRPAGPVRVRVQRRAGV